jgi:hypothetical protein
MTLITKMFLLLTALGTVLLTSGTVVIFEGSSLFARFFFSVNNESHVKYCNVTIQCEELGKIKKKGGGKYVANVHITTFFPKLKPPSMHINTQKCRHVCRHTWKAINSY